jgi:hypothetical protein
MKVNLNSADLLPELIRDLTAASCFVRQLDETSCNVRPIGSRDAEAALVALTFYVAAWARTRPGVEATVAP